MSKVGIIGVGQSAFVRGFPGSIRELAFEGYKEAVKDAQISTKDIEASIICSAPEYDKQRSPAGVFAEYLGLTPQPTCYLESLCSSSSMGLRMAYSLVKSGLHDSVAVIGFQLIDTEFVERQHGTGGELVGHFGVDRLLRPFDTFASKAQVKVADEGLDLLQMAAAHGAQVRKHLRVEIEDQAQ